ncbi:MAG: hypothetical protein QOG80_1428, partial [Pseudonocardiales bacterium]|nr:hypothetical protein [Pseudonocardiales bacterium]
MRLRTGSLAVLALSTVVVAGCTSSKTSTTASNGSSGSLTILVAADGGQNYDPQTNAAPSSTEYLMPVFDTLLSENAQGS